jgi:hypothetical protein
MAKQDSERGAPRRKRNLRNTNERRCQRILDSASPLVLDDLDWAMVPDLEVDPGVLGCLVYMRDVEGFTDRDLVGLAAHRTTLADPLVNRFLILWRAEEAGHTAALERFLGACRTRSGQLPARQAPPPATVSRLERTVASIGGPVGRVVAAAHMTWGAANELLTLNCYRLLARRCEHPVLAELLRRIANQEARHYSFYLLQAEWRLARSPLARTALRRVLTEAWTPVGVGEGYKAPEELATVLAFLAGGPGGEEAIDRMDARFSRLPGMGQLRIYRDAAEHARGLVLPEALVAHR